MGARLLAAIEALKKTPWVVLAVLLASVVGGLAQLTGATRALVALVRPPPPDPRAELAKLGIAFTPEALAAAANDGDGRAAGLLLDAGMAPDATALAGDAALPPLLIAAQAGQTGVAARLIAAGADPARPSAWGTALAHAARYHHPEIVKLFLTRPLPPAVVTDAFVVAGDIGNPAAIALLAPHLADPRGAATTALRERVQRFHDTPRDVAALRALLALHPDLDAPGPTQIPVVHLAVEEDEATALTALLAAGAKPDLPGHCHVVDDPLSPALACAAARGTSDGLASVRALVAAHADVDARRADGMTPLMVAAASGHAEIVAALLAAGADPALRDAKGRTAADHARTADFDDPAATRAALSQAAARRRS